MKRTKQGGGGEGGGRDKEESSKINKLKFSKEKKKTISWHVNFLLLFIIFRTK